jgi:hypothetical protein
MGNDETDIQIRIRYHDTLNIKVAGRESGGRGQQESHIYERICRSFFVNNY